MKKTVVLTPYQDNISGTLDCNRENGGIYINIRLNHPAYDEESVLRLYALSTSHAARKPYLADMFECREERLSTVMHSSDMSAIGYCTDDIDTYVVTIFNDAGETALAGAFLGLEWNAPAFLKKNTAPMENKLQQSIETNPLENARQLLQDRKKAPGATPLQINQYVYSFVESLKHFEKLNLNGDACYEWYKIGDTDKKYNLSSVMHVLCSDAAASAIRDAGYYAVGVHKTDSHHIAIAIPACRHVCPMPNLSDCCSYLYGYHITGIFFGEDGQYFEKHLQNVDD